MRFIVMFVTAVCVLFLIKPRWLKKKSIYEIILIVKNFFLVMAWKFNEYEF